MHKWGSLLGKNIVDGARSRRASDVPELSDHSDRVGSSVGSLTVGRQSTRRCTEGSLQLDASFFNVAPVRSPAESQGPLQSPSASRNPSKSSQSSRRNSSKSSQSSTCTQLDRSQASGARSMSKVSAPVPEHDVLQVRGLSGAGAEDPSSLLAQQPCRRSKTKERMQIAVDTRCIQSSSISEDDEYSLHRPASPMSPGAGILTTGKNSFRKSKSMSSKEPGDFLDRPQPREERHSSPTDDVSTRTASAADVSSSYSSSTDVSDADILKSVRSAMTNFALDPPKHNRASPRRLSAPVMRSMVSAEDILHRHAPLDVGEEKDAARFSRRASTGSETSLDVSEEKDVARFSRRASTGLFGANTQPNPCPFPSKISTLWRTFKDHETFIFVGSGVLWDVDAPSWENASWERRDTVRAELQLACVQKANELLSRGKRVMFICNSAQHSRQSYVEELLGKGLSICKDLGIAAMREAERNIISVGHTCACYLRACGAERPFVFTSERGLIRDLKSTGMLYLLTTSEEDDSSAAVYDREPCAQSVQDAMDSSKGIDAVILGWDKEPNHLKLAVASKHLCGAQPKPIPLVTCCNAEWKRKLRALWGGAVCQALNGGILIDPETQGTDMRSAEAVVAAMATSEEVGGYGIDLSQAVIISSSPDAIELAAHGGMSCMLIMNNVVNMLELKKLRDSGWPMPSWTVQNFADAPF